MLFVHVMRQARSALSISLFTAGLTAAAVPAAGSPAFFRTLFLEQDRSSVDLDLTLAQTSSDVSGMVDVQYDLGPGQSETIGIPQLRAFLADPIFVDVGLFTISAPANSIDVIADAAPGSLANPATNLGDGLWQFTQPDLTLSLAGTLTLDDGETQVEIDLSTVAPSTDQSIVDATLAVGGFGGPNPTLIAPIDSIFALPLGDLTIPVLITGTLTANPFPSIVGDFDRSGQVDQGDLNLVLNNWGQLASFTPNGGAPFVTATVDQEELNRVLNNWGSTGVPNFAGATVPEPASAVLLAFGAALLRRRG